MEDKPRRVAGWRPGGSGASPPPNSPMPTPTPNADLVGTTFPVDGGSLTVTGVAEWNPAYLCVDTPAGPSVRVAAQVRRRKELS